ncbi:hypothetical protein J1C56_01865 [Aminobacter anthyllidis]|uniref:Uncharacterized protein n=1 Tax=Aminobacter anthyllidis TaxID=1035067 RepID=A0A9X1A770_9HYPH|nr:hypothetical protein [Aminobacter anthyllidis]MBT1154331.1 hypothetical protein [Aminobacter anthyllidis]
MADHLKWRTAGCLAFLVWAFMAPDGAPVENLAALLVIAAVAFATAAILKALGK